MADAPTKARWYRVTPGRLLLVLLAVEGFLWLSERFQWFAFNEHKGWTVLIAVASVGVFLLLILLWFLVALVFRLRFQFSILSLLVLMVAVALPFAWLETEMKAAKRQREAVEEIKKVGGQVGYDYQRERGDWNDTTSKTPEPAWLRGLLGDDLFVSVTQAGLSNTKVSGAGLVNLKGLTQLQTLMLDNTKVGDAGLERLKGLAQLKVLWLTGTKVSDAGLKNLQQALPNCQIIHLHD